MRREAFIWKYYSLVKIPIHGIYSTVITLQQHHSNGLWCPCIIYSWTSDCKAAYDCKLVLFHSTDCWPGRYVCCLLAGCTLGYRWRSLWSHTLYQRHFVDHLQEHQGQDYSWQLQRGHSYSFLVATMQERAINSALTKGMQNAHRWLL